MPCNSEFFAGKDSVSGDVVTALGRKGERRIKRGSSLSGATPIGGSRDDLLIVTSVLGMPVPQKSAPLTSIEECE